MLSLRFDDVDYTQADTRWCIDATMMELKRSEVDLLKREFKIGQLLCSNCCYTAKYLEILEEESEDGRYKAAIIMEDCGAKSLSSMIPPAGFSITEFLKISISCAKGVQAVHRNNIIHKDIKPSNMLVGDDGFVYQIDFGCATKLQEQMEQASASLKKTYGTLAYVSPEQTGRINRSIDYRTDFYSMGVTFYQLLTGKLPFQSRDLMELIHQHIAVEPPPLPSHVPPVLRDIVSKLLNKDATDRYQSNQGIIHDLQTCQENLI
ncbi:mitogen-activated protein kinase kinase [Acrasis kona]|uniref:Mitogen-activated protein kinase kinase n=1 Tax=Acrasis kona TaxID=1008807 RepID=A0AAW2YJU7_9EUKA